MTILMYDSTSPSAPPADAPAIAGYIDGFGGFEQMRLDHPHAHHLSITVRAGLADCLDWEPGTARPDPAGWVRARHSQGLFRPCVYGDLSDTHAHILPSLQRLARPSWRLWVAHPTGVEHICGPHTCGALPIDADATQFWFDSISGNFHGIRDVDVSLCRDDFFTDVKPPPPPPPPPPAPKGTHMITTAYNENLHGAEVFAAEGAEVFLREVNPPHAWISVGSPGGPIRMIACTYNAELKGTEVFAELLSNEVFRRQVNAPHAWQSVGTPGAKPAPKPAPAHVAALELPAAHVGADPSVADDAGGAPAAG